MFASGNLLDIEHLAVCLVSDIAPRPPRFPMHTTDRFLRFAAECEVMAKFTRSPENKAVWNGLAQRWLTFLHNLPH